MKIPKGLYSNKSEMDELRYGARISAGKNDPVLRYLNDIYLLLFQINDRLKWTQGDEDIKRGPNWNTPMPDWDTPMPDTHKIEKLAEDYDIPFIEPDKDGKFDYFKGLYEHSKKKLKEADETNKKLLKELKKRDKK